MLNIEQLVLRDIQVCNLRRFPHICQCHRSETSSMPCAALHLSSWWKST